MVNILLIGDSLTEGFYAHGYKFHSYAEKLEELLYRHFPTKSKNNSDDEEESSSGGFKLPFLIHQRGVSGECTDEIAARLTSYLQKAENKGKDSLYDIVCVLGGTNDIGMGVPSQEVCQQLERIYEQIKRHNPNALIVPITIPEARILDTDYVEERKKINIWILEYGKEDSNRIVHVDLETLLPHFQDAEKTQVDSIHWDDHLHMTVKGYDRFGELVFEAIQSHVPKYIK